MSVIKFADYKRCYVCKAIALEFELSVIYDELTDLTGHAHQECYDAEFDAMMLACETLED